MRLIYLSLSWIAGVCLGAWAGFQWAAVAAVVGLGILAVLLRRAQALTLVLCLLVFIGGMLCLQFGQSPVDEGTLQFYNGKGEVQVSGVVVSDPEPARGVIALRLEAREVEAESACKEVSGTALVYVPQFASPSVTVAEGRRDHPYYRYGDLLQIRCRLETPSQLDSLDWPDYLGREGIYSVARYPASIELLDTGQGSKVQGWLYALRERLSQAMASALHEPQSSLAQAILLGKRSGVPPELDEAFFRTGTTHIIAVSGLNVAIVAGLVLSLGAWLFGRRRPAYFVLAIGSVWGYAALTGLEAPVLRAAIMGSLWLVADYIGRPRNALPSLLLAAAVMIGIDPAIVGDVSFQLSFASMAGLILLTPLFQSLSRRLCGIGAEQRTPAAFVVDSLSVTLGAVLATLPIVAFYVHQVSLMALPANLLVLPAVPFIMGAAALVAIVGLFAPPAAQVLGWVAWLFLTYMIEVVESLGRVPFASVPVRVESAFVWGYYILLGVGLWAASSRSAARVAARKFGAAVSSALRLGRRIPARFVVVSLVVVAALVWSAAFALPDTRLHVFFFDVGQGDAILVSTPSGHHILIDGGPARADIDARLGDALPFWERTIDLVVLTHPHEDHVGGLVDVLRRYEVKRVLESSTESDSWAYAEWRRLVDEEGAARSVASEGQRVSLDGEALIEVLHAGGADPGGRASSVDDSSLVLRLTWGNVSMVFAGDIGADTERDLLDSGFNLTSPVLKVAHHGSDSSSCEDFLAGVDPQVAVISVGSDNTFGHPSGEVLERLNGATVYRTDQQGTIELSTDGKRLWVKTER